MAAHSRTLTASQARRILLRAAHLEQPRFGAGVAGARRCLETLGEIQLDPIDRIGTNADLVLHARVDGLQRGDWGQLGTTFEHFSKERCLLPARRFPAWRDHTAQTPWWRLSERKKRLPTAVLDAVYAEVAAHGPLTAHGLTDHGRVKPVDWSGWVGTARAGTMALEVLWTQCRIVVVGRSAAGHRVFDLPERAFREVATQQAPEFFSDGLQHRVSVAGMLRTAGGPQWSALAPMRGSQTVEDALQKGSLIKVGLPGTRRRWLVHATALEAMDRPLDHDDRVRILGPLDPLLWDRPLVERAFGFSYVWEIYKPKDQRRWGYYVCPLLWRGQLVGRIEARRGTAEETPVVVEQLWWEDAAERPPKAALVAMLARLGRMQPKRAPTTPTAHSE